MGSCTTVWQSSVRRRWWKRSTCSSRARHRAKNRTTLFPVMRRCWTKKIAKLDFAQPATKLHDLIRGLSPWPVAHTTFEGKLLKVHRAVVAQAQGDCGPAGKVLDSKN